MHRFAGSLRRYLEQNDTTAQDTLIDTYCQHSDDLVVQPDAEASTRAAI
jgi:hypothetical protein